MLSKIAKQHNLKYRGSKEYKKEESESLYEQLGRKLNSEAVTRRKKWNLDSKQGSSKKGKTKRYF